MTPGARAGPVALVSAATLAFEILLVRAFAIEYVHHLAFMVIGVAMLGIGVAGIAAALIRLDATRADRWFHGAAIAVAAALVASPAAVEGIALDPASLLSGPALNMAVGALYVVLAVPFAAGAMVVLSALIVERDRTGALYGASFVGSALGVAVALAGSATLMPDRALALPAVVAGVAALLVRPVRRPGWLPRAAAAAVALAAAGALAHPPWTIAVAPHKSLPQIEAFPGAVRLAARPHPAGWVAATRAPAFRHAPGLSLQYRGDLPSQTALFVDGELVGAVPSSSPGTAPDFHRWLPSAAAYALGTVRRVAVLGAAGGSGVGTALSQGAERVVAVEPHAGLVPLIQELAGAEATTHPPDGTIEWVARDTRSFAAGTRDRFDLVAVETAGGLGGGTGGVHALGEDYLHTVEAYRAYLGLAGTGGMVTLTSWLTAPPRRSVRMILTAGHALRQAGGDPRTGMVVVRSWGTVTLVLKPSGFDPPEIAALRRWTDSRGFDLDWYPGLATPAFRFHELDDAVTYEAARATAEGPEAARRFADAYPFDVRPVGDARPYPDQFLRLGGLVRVMGSRAGDALPFAELGVAAVVATLAQSVLLGSLFMVLPVAVAGRRRPRPGWRLLAYFAAIGCGYMLVEIAAIQQLTLLLGQPTYAVSAVLATLLMGSGAGSAWSDRLAAHRGRVTTVALAAAVALCAGLLLPVVHLIQPAAMALRSLAALALIAPLGFVMGIPFPVGYRAMAPDATARAWAWAGNGFASVVATPLAMLVALRAGSPALLLVGSAAYGVAALAAARHPPAEAPAG